MKTRTRLIGGTAGALALAAAGAVLADIGDDDELIINGEIEIVTGAPAPDFVEGLSTIYSGWVFRSPETQAMEQDDFENPAMIYVDQAREMFDTPMGSEGQSCSSCHEGGPEEFEMVRATYPQWDEEHGEVQTVEMQVNECLTERMGAEPLDWNGQDMRNMTALISAVGRGQIVDVAIDGPAQSTWEQGEELYYTRFGQLELSCASCHEQNYGNLIRADHLSQGQINGFPTYRLKDANIVSIHNRFRGCIRDTRAETFAIGSPEFIALELYVASRGNGLSVEGPAVRN
ncbi:sulfur oxidation c-type cytochrome SoxA [Rhodobacterales bacterium HKCCE2091]|nr:sulfur oxidation c-type cytochrome SoxA [Rhodobacterales bacterium HKCCE2091]